MNELGPARAYDWLAIIAFVADATDLTEADRERFEAALEVFCESSVDDEISECTTLDQMVELNASLQELVTKYGLRLEDSIHRLESEIADREEERSYDEEGPFGGGSSIVNQEVMSDDDVSEMFSTLRDSRE
jgi:hypothetical protein